MGIRPDFPAPVALKIDLYVQNFNGGHSINWLAGYLSIDDQNTELPSPRHLQYTIQQVLKLGSKEIAATALLDTKQDF